MARPIRRKGVQDTAPLPAPDQSLSDRASVLTDDLLTAIEQSELEPEFKNALTSLYTLDASNPQAVMDGLGFSMGRILLEIGCIAFARGPRMATPGQLLLIAAARRAFSVLGPNAIDEMRRIARLDSALASDFNPDQDVKVTAQSKLAALTMLKDMIASKPGAATPAAPENQDAKEKATFEPVGE